MSKKHLELNPHEIDEFHWWYEEQQGISVVAEAREGGSKYLGTTVTRIKWSAIRAALKRLDKK